MLRSFSLKRFTTAALVAAMLIQPTAAFAARYQAVVANGTQHWREMGGAIGVQLDLQNPTVCSHPDIGGQFACPTIVGVYPNSPADLAGIRVGSKLVSVDDYVFYAAEDLSRYLRGGPPGSSVRISYIPPGGGETYTYAIRGSASRFTAPIPSPEHQARAPTPAPSRRSNSLSGSDIVIGSLILCMIFCPSSPSSGPSYRDDPPRPTETEDNDYEDDPPFSTSPLGW